MKTYQEKEWIWQSKDFGNFYFDKFDLSKIYYKFGKLSALSQMVEKKDENKVILDIFEDEAYSTFAIEGEFLNRSSVRSSINKILKLGFENDYNYTRGSDEIVEVLLDAKTSKLPLTKEKLLSWHRAILQNYSGIKEVKIGQFRETKEDMKIVSGPWEKEKIHYIAPPSSDVEKLMESFFRFVNSSNEEIIYKAIVTHLYFVLIHPFEDGNGRVARILTDFVLSQSDLFNAKFYSISSVIYKKRREYYEVLDKVCRQTNQDITLWAEWFIKLLEESIDETFKRVEIVQIKTKFWQKHINTKLNDRQKKVILKMLEKLPDKFEGGMRTKKYASLTKTTKLTASRDLSDLVKKGVLKSFGSGRGVYYELLLDL
jgi:Fic family protein